MTLILPKYPEVDVRPIDAQIEKMLAAVETKPSELILIATRMLDFAMETGEFPKKEKLQIVGWVWMCLQKSLSGQDAGKLNFEDSLVILLETYAFSEHFTSDTKVLAKAMLKALEQISDLEEFKGGDSECPN